MTANDIVLEVKNCYFIERVKTNTNTSDTGRADTIKLGSAAGYAERDVPNNGYPVRVEIQQEVGGAYSVPDPEARLDPNKQYTVKFVEQ